MVFNSEKYYELLKNFPPRPINCQEKLKATQQVIDSLEARKKLLSIEELEYLNVLGSLVGDYEEMIYGARTRSLKYFK